MNKRHVKLFFALLLVFLMPLSSFASAAMSQRVRSVPSKINDKLFVSPDEDTLVALVKYLTSGAGDTASKVKVLHDWICDNIAYDTDIFFDSSIYNLQEWDTVIVRRKAICSGYTNLMTRMCALAGIEAKGISGWSKDYGYNGALAEKANHAWNAIKIGRSWQLVDVTWDAGYLSGLTYVKHYTTQYLKRTPDQFIYSHFPTNEADQFLAKPWSSKQFTDAPFLSGRFFELGLSLGKKAPLAVNEISGETEFEFKISDGSVLLDCNMYSMDDSMSVPCSQSAWVERRGYSAFVAADIPEALTYQVSLCARDKYEDRCPIVFSSAEYEGVVIPGADELLASKGISKAEYDYLLSSYYEVSQNGCYFYKEDLFDYSRNKACFKVLSLLGRHMFFESVAEFNVKSDGTYKGHGSPYRYPYCFNTYHESKGTILASPRKGSVKRGEKITFTVTSSDFNRLGLLVDGNLVQLKKDGKTGQYTVDYTVGDGIDSIYLCTSSDGSSWAALWCFVVED